VVPYLDIEVFVKNLSRDPAPLNARTVKSAYNFGSDIVLPSVNKKKNILFSSSKTSLILGCIIVVLCRKKRDVTRFGRKSAQFRARIPALILLRSVASHEDPLPVKCTVTLLRVYCD
jgi:hypothetical protein